MTDVSAILTENFGNWTAAIKPRKSVGRGEAQAFDDYGMKKLRDLILDLAIKGTLSPQRSADEPASELVSRAVAAKSRLIEAGVFRKPKKSIAAPIYPETELPKGWVWSHLAELAQITPKNDIANDARVSFVPMELVTTSFDGAHGQEPRVWKQIKKGYTHFADGDIAVAKITPCFENGKAACFRDLEGGVGAGTTELHVARPYLSEVNKRYLLIFLKSPQFLFEGEKCMTGTAGQKRLPKEFFAFSPLPLPPSAEQARIVAKVDELMALCDQLEALQADAIEAHKTLVTTVLDALTKAIEKESFEVAWARIAEHFNTLFVTEWSVDQLKQTILQLAVMGKLIPQDANEESALVQLALIEEKRRQSESAGEIKKQSKLPPLEEADRELGCPTGWQLTRLGNILRILNGRAYKKPEMLASGTPLLRVGNLFTSNEWFYSDLELEPDKYINHGDLIYAWSASFGPFIWEGSKVIYHYHIWKLDPFDPEKFCSRYMLHYLQSVTESIKASGHGIAMLHMTKERMEKLVVAIPPLSEQHRIVAKVDELMAVCAKLKSAIKESQQTQFLLADAITEQTIV